MFVCTTTYAHFREVAWSQEATQNFQVLKRICNLDTPLNPVLDISLLMISCMNYNTLNHQTVNPTNPFVCLTLAHSLSNSQCYNEAVFLSLIHVAFAVRTFVIF